MLEETYKCDGPGCKNTTPKASPSTTWKVVLWLKFYVRGQTLASGDNREKHYCSTKCEHEATKVA